MAHKVHPKIFRIKETADWNSRWFNHKKLPQYLEEDFKIREFLHKKLKEAALQNVEIERFPGKIIVSINSARPGLIIGRGGEGIEKLKNSLEKILNIKKAGELKIEIKEIRDPWSRASLACQWVAQQIEKRLPYRRVLKQTLEKIMASKEVKGAKVEVSGRLMGAEIAREEWLKKGQLPRQTIRANIDYCHCEAYCTYGVIGVKVWIYKGEKF